MEFWPTDFRTDNSVLQRRRNGTELYTLTGQDIDVGSLGATTLSFKRNYLEWQTLVQPPGKVLPRQIGDSIQMLPPRSPQIALQETSAGLQAEKGVKFLRTNYPDVDISADLLKEEIQEDEDLLKAFDPYQGNQLAQLVFLDKEQRKLDFIASPCGEVGSELNVYPVRGTDHRYSSNFIPVSKPLLNLHTPIRQLETFPRVNITENYSLLAVRTYDSVSMLKISLNEGDSSNHPLTAESLYSFSSAKTGPVVDMNCGGISHTNGRMLLVNDTGVVSLLDTEGEIHSRAPPSDTSDDLEETPNRFWRVAWADVNTYMHASMKQLHLFDSRDSDIPSTRIVYLNNPNEYLTSIESIPVQNPLLGVSTTTRLLLFDARNLTRPVISLNHHRSFDQTLRLKSFSADNTMWHTLSSSQNRLTTVYSTTCSTHDLIHLQGMHYILPSSLKIELPIIGSHIFQKSSNESGSPISYLQLSPRDLWSTDVILSPSDEVDLGTKCLNPVHNEDMEELMELSEAMSHLSEEDELESTQVDMTAVYEKITQVQEEDKDEEEPEHFYRALDEMSSFWQGVDTPVEHMLTTFDVAFRLGEEPQGSLRADFLNGTVLNSSRGLSALLQGRLPVSELSESAPWSFDLGSLSPTLVPDLAKPPQQLLDQLIEEAVNKEKTSSGIKFAIKAAQELVVDLNLSRHVYAPRKFTQETNTDNDLLDATQALSLDPAALPPYEFAYLQPVSTQAPEKTFEPSHGVKLLLSEWKVGTKPEDYVFYDWYGSRNDPLPEHDKSKGSKKRFEPSNPQPLRGAPPVVLSRPPPIATSQPTSGPSRVPPPFAPRSLYPIHERLGGSQVDMSMRPHEGLSQEPFYPNTQPLPGVFGGQLNLNKKKTVKKRIGGF